MISLVCCFFFKVNTHHKTILTSNFIEYSYPLSKKISPRLLRYFSNLPTLNNWPSLVIVYMPSEWRVWFSSASRHRSLFPNKPCVGKRERERTGCENMFALSKPISFWKDSSAEYKTKWLTRWMLLQCISANNANSNDNEWHIISGTNSYFSMIFFACHTSYKQHPKVTLCLRSIVWD